MERDMELVREILLDLEKKSDFRSEYTPREDLDPIKVAYHLKIMDQAGIIKSNVVYGDGDPFLMSASITWEGQEFLDAIKNDTVWNNLMKKMKKESSTIPFSLLKSLAFEQTRNLFS